MLAKKRYADPSLPLQSPRQPGNVCVEGGKAPAVLQCLAFTCITCSTKRLKKKKKVLLEYFLQEFRDNVLYVPNLLAELPDLPQPEP